MKKFLNWGCDIIADVGFSVFDFVAEAVAAVDVDCHSAADFVDVGFADSVDSAGFVDWPFHITPVSVRYVAQYVQVLLYRVLFFAQVISCIKLPQCNWAQDYPLQIK